MFVKFFAFQHTLQTIQKKKAIFVAHSLSFDLRDRSRRKKMFLKTIWDVFAWFPCWKRVAIGERERDVSVHWEALQPTLQSVQCYPSHYRKQSWQPYVSYEAYRKCAVYLENMKAKKNAATTVKRRKLLLVRKIGKLKKARVESCEEFQLCSCMDPAVCEEIWCQAEGTVCIKQRNVYVTAVGLGRGKTSICHCHRARWRALPPVPSIVLPQCCKWPDFVFKTRKGG